MQNHRLWQGGAWERPQGVLEPLKIPGQTKKKKFRKTRRVRGRGILPFALFLTLILGLVGTALLLNDLDIYQYLPPVVHYEQEKEHQPTTIPRAGVNKDVTLTLEPKAGQTLTLQEIYDRNISSIVYVRAFNDAGVGSAGTGVVMTQDGYIITNQHIIDGASSAQIVLWDNTVLDAKLVGAHVGHDLAVLKVDASDLTPARFADSDDLRVGDQVVAMGNPLGSNLRGTMTQGIVSGMERSMNMDGTTMSLIQTTAALNQGNSGGALINDRGQVIGITNMKIMSRYSTIEGLGFAIPTRFAKGLVDQMIATGQAKLPALGIRVLFNREQYGGLWVQDVQRHSDAWAKGLRPGDVIVAVNDVELTDDAILAAMRDRAGVGGTLKLTVKRNDQTLEIEIVLMDSELFS